MMMKSFFLKSITHVDLAEKIKWANNNMSLMINKSEYAFEKLKLEYQWQSISQKYDNLYQQLLLGLHN